MIGYTKIDFRNDRLKKIQQLLNDLAPHEHADGINECHTCDQPLDAAILQELKKVPVPSSSVEHVETEEKEPPPCGLCGRPPHPDSYGHSYRPRDKEELYGEPEPDVTADHGAIQKARELAFAHAYGAAKAFIESHVADPDITEEMTRKYADYQEAEEQLKRVLLDVGGKPADASFLTKTNKL